MEDISRNIARIRRGDIFWECEGGQDAAFVATCDARRDGQGIAVEARDLADGKRQRFFEHDRAGAYGPRLYAMPQYTRPDWPALLAGLAKIAFEEVDDAEKRAAAREASLKLAATQYSESRDHWLTEARQAQAEVARLRSMLDTVESIAAQKLNGISMGRQILTALEEAR